MSKSRIDSKSAEQREVQAQYRQGLWQRLGLRQAENEDCRRAAKKAYDSFFFANILVARK